MGLQWYTSKGGMLLSIDGFNNNVLIMSQQRSTMVNDVRIDLGITYSWAPPRCH